MYYVGSNIHEAMPNFSFSNIILPPLKICLLGQQKVSNHQNSHKAFKKKKEYSRRAFVEKKMFIHIWLLCISRTSKYHHFPKAFFVIFGSSTFYFLPRLQITVIGLCHPSFNIFCWYKQKYLYVFECKYDGNTLALNQLAIPFLKTPMKRYAFDKYLLEILLLWYNSWQKF